MRSEDRNTSERLSSAKSDLQPSRRDAIKLAIASVAGAGAASGAAGQLHAVPPPFYPGESRASASETIKAQAQADYAQSLNAFQGRLAMPPESLRASVREMAPVDYEVIIVGSGYGASICAARLAARLRPGARLCVLERGKEWVPGTFPDTFRGCSSESMRTLVGLDTRTVHNPTGLINLVQGKDVSVLSASALGGTSLINGNVSIRPDPEVFSRGGWPTLLSNRLALEAYYDRADQELGVTVEPIDSTQKMVAQRLAAERLADCGAHFEASTVTLTRGLEPHLPIINRQGMIQRPCTNCGDCTSGCNVGAKNTLAMNYLPIARQHGAHIFTQTEVVALDKHAHGYTLWYKQYTGQGRDTICVEGCVRARMVILGAGSLGSTELLLRSQNANMQFSPNLGSGWSCNGDILGLVRRTTIPTHIAGTGTKDLGWQPNGPAIQSNIRYPNRPRLEDRIMVQDGMVSTAYVPFMSLFGRDLGLDHTQMLVVAGHDGAQGRIELESDGSAVVRWPNLYHHPYRKIAEDEMQRVAHALGGEYREMLAFKGRVGTVHPLGGCNMADDPMHGVTNHRCQVFDGCGGGAIDPRTSEPMVHHGLYVVDGASVPTSLGVNPLATISAIAERSAELITLDPAHADLFVS